MIGLGVHGVRRLLAPMRDRGDIRFFERCDGLACRAIVPADHPEAEELVIFIGRISRQRRER